jgi:hypothetical protein
VVFVICAMTALIVMVIVAAQLHAGGPIAPLSLALPGLALAWVAVLGLQISRYRPPEKSAPAPPERPSRRPPRFDRPGRAERSSDTGRHASA